jgi:hypothetical protein
MSSAKLRPPKVPKKPSTPAVSGVYESPLGGRWVSISTRAIRPVATSKKDSKDAELHAKRAGKYDPSNVASGIGKAVDTAPSRPNPYASISPERIWEILLEANVITKTGRLTKVFR